MNVIDGPRQHEFEEMFLANQETLVVHGGEINTVDINPDADGPAIMLAPGFLAGNEAQKEVIRFFAGQGHRVLSLEHARRGGRNLDGDFHDVLEQPAESLIAMMDHKSIQDVDLVGHSAGFIHAVMAAARDDQDRVRSVTGIGPAGIVQSKIADYLTSPAMIIRGAAKMRGQANRREVIAETSRYIRGNINRTTTEARVIPRTDVMELVEKVAARIPVTVLIENRDEIFKSHKYVGALRRYGWEEVAGLSVASVMHEGASHAEYLSNEFVMSAVLEAIEIRRQRAQS